jgi:hypothetical protein
LQPENDVAAASQPENDMAAASQPENDVAAASQPENDVAAASQPEKDVATASQPENDVAAASQLQRTTRRAPRRRPAEASRAKPASHTRPRARRRHRYGKGTADVLISNLTCEGQYAGVAIGSEMSGGVDNVTVRDVRFVGGAKTRWRTSRRGRRAAALCAT